MYARAPIFSGIAEAVSPEAPCGPDTDEAPETQNFLSVAEGQLPGSYRDFDKKAFEAKPVLEKLLQQLEKSRDLRFLMLYAKYSILSDSFPGFCDAIIATHDLLSAQWEACHPTEQAGGAALRSAYLSTLDDLPTVVLPLLNTPIIVDKRLGALSMRTIQVANKKLPAQPGETAGDPEAIAGALQRYEPLDELVAFKTRAETAKQALKNLHQLFVDKVDHATAPTFQRLPELLDTILVQLNKIIVERVGDSTPLVASTAEGDGAGKGAADGAVASATPASGDDPASFVEVSSALESVLAYYSTNEPSSPARLLIKQAHQLVGKSFVEAMQVLAPGLVQETSIKIGGDAPFALDFAQLSSLATQDEIAGGDDTEIRTFSVATRAAASALMLSIERFYRRCEPSSPIPLLLERARAFASKDFASLLKEMVKQNDAQ